MKDAETIYLALRACAEEHGYVTSHADDLLGQVAEFVAEAGDVFGTD